MTWSSQGFPYDSAAALLLPGHDRARVVLRRGGVAAHGAAVAVGAGAPAGGRARGGAIPPRRARAGADGGGRDAGAARRARAGRGRRGARGGRRRARAARRRGHLRHVRQLALLPGESVVRDFHREHPDVRIRLVGQNSSEVVEAIRAGELEAGVVVLPIDDSGLEVQPAMRDDVYFCSAVRPVCARRSTMERLVRAPLILSDAAFGVQDPIRRQLAAAAQLAGVTIKAAIDVEDPEIALELAGQGLGETDASRGTLHSRAARVTAAGVGAVRRAHVRRLRLRVAPRRPAVPRDARLRGRRRAALRRAAGAPRPGAAPAFAGGVSGGARDYGGHRGRVGRSRQRRRVRG